MVDRQKVETILTRRFPGATRHDIAAAANAIMGLSEEWEEVVHADREPGYHASNECGSICYLVPDSETFEFRIFRRREH